MTSAVRLYDPRSAAAMLSVRESTSCEGVRRRRVPHPRLGRATRFRDDDLAAIVAASLVAPAPAVPAPAVPASVVPIPLPKRGRRRAR